MRKTVSFIDVGTNSIHMLVVRFFEGSMGTPVFQDKESVRMGKSLYEKGRIDVETLDKITLVAGKFVEVSRRMGAEEIVAMATSAAREAENGSDVVSLFERLGVRLHVIPGKEEARLIRLGVLGPYAKEKTLCIDIGGGSTEISISEGEKTYYLDSLELGAIRMAYGTGIDQRGPVSPARYDTLKRVVDTKCYRSVGAVREIGFDKAVGSSGTLTAIGEVCGSRRADKDTSYILRSELRSLMRELCAMDSSERAKISKIGTNRADIVIGGGAVLDELMGLFKIDRIEVSGNGLREGMMTDYLLNNGHTDFDARSSAVRNLRGRCCTDEQHVENVVRYTAGLYDALVNGGLMERDPLWRELLLYAAELHDIGEFINYEGHNVHSYTIIRNSYLPGFDSEEIELMALMARFHHKSFPKPTSKYLVDVRSENIDMLLKCSLVLKIADILDRGRDGAIDRISLDVFWDRTVLRLGSSKDISMVLWKLSSIGDVFRGVFNRDFDTVHDLI
ncbi:MAG: Ppx/GppA family phosphatase [archaeon]|nr:Ppx/GppA family phosphatase [archaeon]